MEAVVRAAPEGPPRLSLEDFDYDLPVERIAQAPVSRRDEARMLVLARPGGEIVHSRVERLAAWLRPGDLLILNDARVIPARLRGEAGGGAGVELLLLQEQAPGQWDCLGKPARRLRAGARLRFTGEASAEVIEARGEGRYTVRFGPPEDVRSLLERCGEIPLPPYIKRPSGPLPLDRERYQSVFAASEGAVAAPTAGLHFTPELLAALRAAGIEIAMLTLHVGPATFLPVRSLDQRRPVVEPERASIPEATADAVRRAKREGGRVVAVGTTTVRALESAAYDSHGLSAGVLSAGAFITPGFRFRIVDALLTNFHLPRSTLLMLVSAFAGREPILAAYSVAVREEYRFYSYGDAMLIV
jgi:S-adenosylmethionine:tRNA ribosyltransferase-isomerase